jgi:hypothetical protein
MFGWLRLPADCRSILLWVLRFDILIIVVGWILMWLSERAQIAPADADTATFVPPWYHIPINLIASTALILVAIITFFGFFFASSANGSDFGHATRNAVTAAFVGLYLVILPFILLSPQYFASLFGDAPVAAAEDGQIAVASGVEYARELFNGFTGFLTTIIAFYFAAQVVDKASSDVKESTIAKSENEAEAARANAEAARYTAETARVNAESAAAERAAS